MEFTCPSTCPGSCQVDCNTCKPVCSCDKPGAVCQDPRFIGGDGTTFYFHGKKDTNFCLVSDPNLHINAHFIGKRNQNMKRDFTWVQSIAILFNNNHTLFIAAQKTATWDDSNDRVDLSFDGQPIALPQSEGATWTSQTSPRVTVSRAEDSATNSVVVEVEGKLKMAVMGGSGAEFQSSTLFSTDCSVSRFVGDNGEKNNGEGFDFEGMSCQSGMDGEGVVCRR
ncbi:hypothetical protein PIB30_050762 [Stylosanthes scabra]|uniref:Root cap n=1 Tax=Stylosanthes scabra TaxID=79078 RepID=A0ABU6VJP4_9FABA|nr:hypothetical protein [Stylosanthes scabra]